MFNFTFCSAEDDPIIIPESEGSPPATVSATMATTSEHAPPPMDTQTTNPIRASLVQGPPAVSGGITSATIAPFQVRRSPISSRTRSRIRPEGVPSGNGLHPHQIALDIAPRSSESWLLRSNSASVSSTANIASTPAVRPGGLAYHLPPVSSLGSAHSLPSGAAIVSPNSPVFSPTDQHYQTLHQHQPVFPMDVTASGVTAREQQMYRVIDSSTGCPVVLPLPLNQQVISSNVHQSSVSLAQFVPVISQSIAAMTATSSLQGQPSDPMFPSARYLIRQPSYPPPPYSAHSTAFQHRGQTLPQPLPLSAAVKPDLPSARRITKQQSASSQQVAQSLSNSPSLAGATSTLATTTSTTAMATEKCSNAQILLKGSVDSPIVIEDGEDPLITSNKSEGNGEGVSAVNSGDATEHESQILILETEEETGKKAEEEKEEEREETRGKTAEEKGEREETRGKTAEEKGEGKREETRGKGEVEMGKDEVQSESPATDGGGRSDSRESENSDTHEPVCVESVEEMEVVCSHEGKEEQGMGVEGVAMKGGSPERHIPLPTAITVGSTEECLVANTRPFSVVVANGGMSVDGGSERPNVASATESESFSETCEPAGPLISPNEEKAPVNHKANESEIGHSANSTSETVSSENERESANCDSNVSVTGSTEKSRDSELSSDDTQFKAAAVDGIESTVDSESEKAIDETALHTDAEAPQITGDSEKNSQQERDTERESPATKTAKPEESPVKGLKDISVVPVTPTDTGSEVNSPSTATPGGILKHTSQFDTPTSSTARVRRVQFASSPVVFQPSRGEEEFKTPKHCELGHHTHHTPHTTHHTPHTHTHMYCSV